MASNLCGTSSLVEQLDSTHLPPPLPNPTRPHFPFYPKKIYTRSFSYLTPTGSKLYQSAFTSFCATVITRLAIHCLAPGPQLPPLSFFRSKYPPLHITKKAAILWEFFGHLINFVRSHSPFHPEIIQLHNPFLVFSAIMRALPLTLFIKILPPALIYVLCFDR